MTSKINSIQKRKKISSRAQLVKPIRMRQSANHLKGI